MKSKKINHSKNNSTANFIKIIKKSNFVIFIIVLSLALIFCVITLNNIINSAYGVPEEKANGVGSSSNIDLITKIDGLKSSQSVQLSAPAGDNPFSG